MSGFSSTSRQCSTEETSFRRRLTADGRVLQEQTDWFVCRGDAWDHSVCQGSGEFGELFQSFGNSSLFCWTSCTHLDTVFISRLQYWLAPTKASNNLPPFFNLLQSLPFLVPITVLVISCCLRFRRWDISIGTQACLLLLLLPMLTNPSNHLSILFQKYKHELNSSSWHTIGSWRERTRTNDTARDMERSRSKENGDDGLSVSKLDGETLNFVWIGALYTTTRFTHQN